LRNKATQSFETSRTTRPTMQRNTPEDQSRQEHRCGNVRTLSTSASRWNHISVYYLTFCYGHIMTNVIKLTSAKIKLSLIGFIGSWLREQRFLLQPAFIVVLFFLSVSLRPHSGAWPTLMGFRDHTHWTHTHTHSVGLLWASDQPDAETSTWHNNTHDRQTSIHFEGFEPTIPASERPQTHVLDRAATGIGLWSYTGWDYNNTGRTYSIMQIQCAGKWAVWIGVNSKRLETLSVGCEKLRRLHLFQIIAICMCYAGMFA